MKTNQEQQLQEGQYQQSEKSEGEDSSQFIKTSRAGRKNLCDVCVKSLAKYTCPACQTKSCSLNCINKHKNEKDCSGKPEHTRYIQKEDINEDVVRKDFQFVKQMLKQSDKVKKTLTGVTSQVQQPKRFYFLRKHARCEYNIKIHQAPPIIQRHRQNISFYYMRTKTIYWVIQILYYKHNNKYTRNLLQPQPDSKTIQELLPKDFLCQELLVKDINTHKTEEFDIFIQNRESGEKQERNKKEADKNTARETIENQKRTVQVAKDKKLCEVLRNMNIYEFPTLILVHKSLRKQFLRKKKIY